MRKTCLRVFAILVATIMIITNGIIFSKAEAKEITTENNKGKITIRELESGVNVSLYQLTTVQFEYSVNQPKDPVYAWTDGIKEWLNTGENEYSEYIDPEKLSNEISDDTIQSDEFYSALIAACRTSKIDSIKQATANGGKATYPVTDENTTQEVVFDSCDMGTYLVLIENGYRVYTPSVVNLTPKFNESTKKWELEDADNIDNNVSVEIKSTSPQITKTVTNAEKTSDNYSTKDTINFIIEADMPKYIESSLSEKYTISDKLSEGLNLNVDSIKVYGVKDGEDDVELKASEHYILNKENAKNANNTDVTFSIDFNNYSKIKKYKKVKITYSANLEKAKTTELGKNGNKNTAYLDYSNNPYDDTSVQTQESSNTVYTYGIEVTKVDKTLESTKLEGAEFKISKDNKNLKFKKVDDAYYQTKDDDSDENASETLTTDNAGLLKIYGLDEGTYILTETKAPDKYNLAEKSVTIEIKDANDGVELNGIIKVKKDGTGEIESEDESGVYKLTFPNTKGFQLPVTGGIGTILFVAGGIVLVGIGLSLLVIVIKRKKNN